ncbi:MAG TPA: hypothetical protein VFS42_08680 [Burkholderiaceae bacterium]|nr:hypothetical protein [Burkholderiaceae bacterium]
MQGDEIQVYAKFGFAMRRAGTPVDLVKFAQDDNYAREMLTLALNSSQPDLVQLAQQTLSRRDASASASSAPAPTKKPTGNDDDDPPDAPKKRFVRSLR